MSFEETRDAAETAIRKLAAAAGRLNSKTSPDDLKQTNAEASRYQREAESAIRKLETEAKGSAPSARRTQLDSISTLKADLAKARSTLQKSNDAASRGELLTRNEKSQRMEAESLDKLGAASDKAAGSTAKLQQATQVLSETTDIGVSVIDTMQQQRESLLRSTTKVSSTNSLTERAKGIMRMMQARAITNKALLFFVVLLLLTTIGVVVYFGYIKEPSK